MAEQAFAELKVVDFSWVLAGPLIGLYLAHHGATVIRVESMRRPDLIRTAAPYKDNKPGLNRSGQWDLGNSNKLGMGLDLTHPKGVEVAKRLVMWSDIVVENFAPGVIERLGLGYEELRKVKPDIIMASTSNMGQTGPEAKHPGLGTILVSYAGFTSLTGWPDRSAVKPYGAYTDFLAPRFQIVAILAAIEYRRRTGKGQYLETSQMETGMHFLSPAIMDCTINRRIQIRAGNKCPFAAPHGVYPCLGDDRWCAIAVFSDEHWDALCRSMGNPAWARGSIFATLLGRKRSEEELDNKIAEWTMNFDAEELMQRLQKDGVPAGLVENSADIQDDIQLAHRHYYWQLDHPEIGVHHYEGPAYILSETPAEIKMPSPLLGQHTELVCREILGMSDEEFLDLLNQGVFE